MSDAERLTHRTEWIVRDKRQGSFERAAEPLRDDAG